MAEAYDRVTESRLDHLGGELGGIGVVVSRRAGCGPVRIGCLVIGNDILRVDELVSCRVSRHPLLEASAGWSCYPRVHPLAPRPVVVGEGLYAVVGDPRGKLCLVQSRAGAARYADRLRVACLGQADGTVRAGGWDRGRCGASSVEVVGSDGTARIVMARRASRSGHRVSSSSQQESRSEATRSNRAAADRVPAATAPTPTHRPTTTILVVRRPVLRLCLPLVINPQDRST